MNRQLTERNYLVRPVFVTIFGQFLLPFPESSFLYIIDEFITGPTARTQQFAFEAVALEAVTFKAVTLEAVTFEAVALEAVAFEAVTLEAVAFEAALYVAVPP
jgi:Pentapeptide repeats (9 copies)